MSRRDVTQFEGAAEAWRLVYERAKIGASDLDLAEVHDCFTIAELLAIEDLGFVDKGEGGLFARENRGLLNHGNLTVNPSGGLKSKGHTLGATGTGQIVEIFNQLRGDVESQRQVRDAEFGLTHNVGGSGATCAVHIFGREII